MNFDIASILYLLLGFSLLIPIAIAGATINQLMAIRIQRPHLVLKDRSQLPDYLNEVFAHGIKLLEQLGFEYHHCQYSLDIVCHQHSDKWSLVFINKETSTFAEISPASTFLDLPGYEIDFWTIARDGSALITLNGRGHTILCGITHAEIHDPMAITLAEVYQSHLSEREDVFGKKPLVAVSSENYIKVQQKLFDGYFLNLMNERAVVSTGHNQFRMAFSKARRLLFQVLKGQKRLRKLLHDKLIYEESQGDKPDTREQVSLSGSNFSVEAEVQSYLRMRSAQERTPGGVTARLVLFFLVLSLTYMAFDLSFSIYSVFILIAVMSLHELGHITAMMFFGYRNLQVLFFPLFVDTTSSDKPPPTIWKQALVHLMGPVPGIFIGLILLGLSQEYLLAWLYEAAIVFLVINYINLLPVAPLDGGHLIRLTILERFPSGKLILSGMSAIAFAAGGWFLGEPVFWVLALILFATLPWSALEAGVLSELFEPTNDFEKQDREKRLTSLFETFRQSKFQKLQYLQKFNLVKGLSDTLLQRDQLGRLGTLGLNAIYLATLIFTPAAAIVTMIGMDDTVDMVAQIQGKPLEKNWDTIIENTDDPSERFATTLKAARFYTTTNNFNKAQYFLELAEKTLALIYNEEHLSNLYQTYSFYYLNKQELTTAEEYQEKVIKLLDQNTDENAFFLATSYQSLANIHVAQKSSRALLDLKTSLSYALNVKSPEERYVIMSILNQLISRYYENSDYTSAKTTLLDSLSILSRYNDTPSKYVAGFVYQELGWMSLVTGNLNYSIKQFENALSLSDENIIRIVDISQYGYDPFIKVNIFLAMALVQHKAGNINSAREYLERAENALKPNYTETLTEYVNSNLPDLIKDGDQSDNQAAQTETVNLDRITKRWQMIAELFNNDTITTEPLKLPQATLAIEPGIDAEEPRPETERTFVNEPVNEPQQAIAPESDSARDNSIDETDSASISAPTLVKENVEPTTPATVESTDTVQPETETAPDTAITN